MVAKILATSGCLRCPRASRRRGSLHASSPSTSPPLRAFASDPRGVVEGPRKRSLGPDPDLRNPARSPRSSLRLAHPRLPAAPSDLSTHRPRPRDISAGVDDVPASNVQDALDAVRRQLRPINPHRSVASTTARRADENSGGRRSEGWRRRSHRRSRSRQGTAYRDHRLRPARRSCTRRGQRRRLRT